MKEGAEDQGAEGERDNRGRGWARAHRACQGVKEGASALSSPRPGVPELRRGDRPLALRPPRRGTEGAAIGTVATEKGLRSLQLRRRLGGGGPRAFPAPPRPGTSRPTGRGARPLAGRAPRAVPIGRPRGGACGHGGGRAVGGRRTGGGLHGRRAAGMAGVGLRAAARRWLPCQGPRGSRAASSSPSCPGCGPPGPGAHCPGAPCSAPAPAPAGGAELSAHLWARYQDMRRLVHGG